MLHLQAQKVREEKALMHWHNPCYSAHMKSLLTLMMLCMGALCVSACDHLDWQKPDYSAYEFGEPEPVTGSIAEFFPRAVEHEIASTQAEALLTKKPTAHRKSIVSHATQPIKVGLLLPLTGKSKVLGNDLLQAATLALHDAYVGPKSARNAMVTLMPKDTKASPTTAAVAAREVIEQGAQMIIGPLYSESTKAVAEVAKARGIPVISLSNNRRIATDWVFAYGLSPEEEVARIVEHALAGDLKTFAILAPNDAYGEQVLNQLKESIKPRGGKLLHTELFVRGAGEKEKSAMLLIDKLQDQSVDALLIAARPEPSAKMLHILSDNHINIAGLQLLGTGLWDVPESATHSQLQGGLYPSTSQASYHQFHDRFKAAHGYAPMWMSKLAYDAVNLTVRLHSKGKPLTAQAFVSEGLIVGPASGSYRIGADGIVKRSYGVMRIGAGSVRNVAPAPRLF